MTSPVTSVTADGVTTITLNRPEAMNSLNLATKEALLEAVTAAAEDTAVRCVVLTGSGRAFCVGQDLKEHVTLLHNDDKEAMFATVPKHYNPIVSALAGMPKPVIAAVNGVAAGAGASLTLACDMRILAESAGFNLAFTGVGLSCDTGMSWTLPRLIGRAKAIELLYFGGTLSAAESLELGLATRVVPDADFAAEVGALAAKLAAGPTLAYGAIRRAVNLSSTHEFSESLAFEAAMIEFTASSADHRRAVDAFLAKEKPVFEGR